MRETPRNRILVMIRKLLNLLSLKQKERLREELLHQHETYEADYDLCVRIVGGYVDVINSARGWRVCVLDAREELHYPTRKEAVDYLIGML